MPYPKTKADEDFRNRYPVETAGMPTYLANIAAKNLATEDASIEKVNAAGRLNPSPGVGAIGSTPETDSANMSVVQGMSAADKFAGNFTESSRSTVSAPSLTDAHLGDIMERRSQIDQKRKEIMANLGMIPPSEAGFSAVVTPSDDKWGRQRKKEMLSQLSLLDSQSKDLLQEHHYAATEAARTAHENLARETHIAASNDFASMSNDLLALQKNPDIKPGTPEFKTAALEIAKNHPKGFQTQAGQTLFRGVANNHDAAANLEDRSYWQRFGQAFKEASVVARKVGGDVQYDDQGFPSIALTGQKANGGEIDPETADKELNNAYGIRQTNLLNPQSVRVVGKPRSDDPGNVNGNFVEVKTLAKGQPTTVFMPKTDYLKYGGKLADESVAAPAAAAGPSDTTAHPNITAEAHAALKSGDTFWWNGKQLTKK